MSAYYNEIEPYAAQWLRNLIGAGLIADGEVDTRSIADVRADDLRGFAQCHFFAGIAGWSGALRRAGWPDDRPVWTGSCPCQPFSVAGKRQGFSDDRHLWPVWRDLIKECRPPIVLGEQVASASDWLRLVRSDLETMGYAVGAIPIEAASAGADHLRDRYWFVADAEGQQVGAAGQSRQGCDVANASAEREQNDQGDAFTDEGQVRSVFGGSGDYEWVIGADGKSRRVKPGIRLLADGVPARASKLRALGNAIDLRPATAFVMAVMGA